MSEFEKAQQEWEAALCFVNPRNEGWAWFTTGRLCDVSGDDWHKNPYECNCSHPYEGSPGSRFVKVAFDGDWAQPKDGHYNSPYSVDAVNAGAVAWLRHDGDDGEITCIPAGTTLRNFRRLIERGGGRVYLPAALSVEIPPRVVLPESWTQAQVSEWVQQWDALLAKAGVGR